MAFNGKKCIVTGGSNGIGLAIVRELLVQGAKIIGLFDINEPANTIQSLQMDFPTQCIEFYSTDVSCDVNLRQSFTTFITKHHSIDVTVANAGIFNEINPKKAILVNVLGAIMTMEIATEMMSRQNERGGSNGGIIVCTSSMSAFKHTIFRPIYGATKRAVLNYTKTMGNDICYETHGIKFISICPGATDTGMADDVRNLVKPEYQHLTQNYIPTSMQSVEILAKLYVDLILTAANGTIWLIEHGEIKEYILKDVL